jgi:hypothetical protein
MRNVIAALLLAFTAVTGSGCFYSHGQVDLLGSGDKFDGDYERFTRLVRWGHWEMATPLVLEHEQDAFIATMQQLGTVKFTDWEVMVMDMKEGFETAHVEIRLEGYRVKTLETFSGILVQDWVRINKVSSDWKVKPDFTSVTAAIAAK